MSDELTCMNKYIYIYMHVCRRRESGTECVTADKSLQSRIPKGHQLTIIEGYNTPIEGGNLQCSLTVLQHLQTINNYATTPPK